MILVLTQKAIEMMSSFVLEIFTYFKEEKLKPFVVLFQSFSDTELFGVRKNKKMFQMVELYSLYKKKQKIIIKTNKLIYTTTFGKPIQRFYHKER